MYTMFDDEIPASMVGGPYIPMIKRSTLYMSVPDVYQLMLDAGASQQMISNLADKVLTHNRRSDTYGNTESPNMEILWSIGDKYV